MAVCGLYFLLMGSSGLLFAVFSSLEIVVPVWRLTMVMSSTVKAGMGMRWPTNQCIECCDITS